MSRPNDPSLSQFEARSADQGRRATGSTSGEQYPGKSSLHDFRRGRSIPLAAGTTWPKGPAEFLRAAVRRRHRSNGRKLDKDATVPGAEVELALGASDPARTCRRK